MELEPFHLQQRPPAAHHPLSKFLAAQTGIKHSVYHAAATALELAASSFAHARFIVAPSAIGDDMSRISRFQKIHRTAFHHAQKQHSLLLPAAREAYAGLTTCGLIIA